MTSATPPGQCTTVLHDDNIRMRKLHELFRYECDIAMRKAPRFSSQSARSTMAYHSACLEPTPTRRIEAMNHKLADMIQFADGVLSNLGQAIDRIAGSQPMPCSSDAANQKLASSDLDTAETAANRLFSLLREISDQASRLTGI